YIVQRGDTLFNIASRFGVSLSSLAAANGISNVNLIFVGEQLTIPGTGGSTNPPPPPPPTGNGTTYIIQRGDTLGLIAVRFGVSVADIMSANGLNSNLIFVGQVLVIPGSDGGSGNPPPPQPTTAPPPPPPAGNGAWELGGQVSDFSAQDKMKTAGMVWVKR